MSSRLTWRERLLPVLSVALSIAALVRVAWRRTLRHPLVPAWSFLREWIREVQAATLQTLCSVRPAVARSQPQLGMGRDVATRVASESLMLAEVPAARIRPSDAATELDLIYLHGGGYNLGSIESHRELASRLALAADACVWSLDYRLAPECPFPAAVDDAETAWRELISRGLDPDRTFIGGDSAGGGLACALLQRLKMRGLPYPRGAVLICPATNAVTWGDSMQRNARFDFLTQDMCEQWLDAYLAGHPADDPLVSPQFADVEGWPAILIHAGGREVLLDQIEDFARHLSDHGVPVTVEREPDEIHVWHLLGGYSREALASVERIASWMRATAETGPSATQLDSRARS